MKLVGSSMVVTVDLRPGVRVAASWGGGPYVSIHAVTGGGFGLILETLPVWSSLIDAPVIEQTLEALERFVLERLQDVDADGWLAAMVEDVEHWEDERAGDLVPVSAN